MKVRSGKLPAFEPILLAVLLAAFALSFLWLPLGGREPVDAAAWTPSAAQKLDLPVLGPPELRPPSPKRPAALFAGELRVAAIGSAYPISYDAAVCPFTGMPQPSDDQLDRDDDGITDGWEIKFGFNCRDRADAQQDADGDGFSQLEEFIDQTDPTDSGQHPPYVKKLRFLKQHIVDFPLVFQAVSRLTAGEDVFQLNDSDAGISHFVALGERVDGLVVERFIPGSEGAADRLLLRRDGVEIVLPKGEKIADPESRAELINILDRSRRMVTMGALLSLRNDVYTVLSVHSDRVVMKQNETGTVYNVVGLAEGERKRFF